MKTKLILFLLIFISLSACKTIKTNDSKANVYFEINQEKTYVDNIGGIMLSFNLVNNSKEDLVILMPNNTFHPRFDFFSNTMECEDIPIWSSESDYKHLKVKDENYLTVKSKTSAELLMNGRNYGWLACNSDNVKIKIKYEPFDIIKDEDKHFKEKKTIMKTISKLKIYSDDVVISLKK